MARLKILSADEFTNLYTTPKLEDADRKFVFDLDDDDLAYISNIDVPRKINYILQLTYFRLSQYFFSFTFQGSRSDVWYVIQTYFPDSKFPKKNISKNHSYQNRKAILNKYDMVLYSSKFKAKLVKYAQELAKKHVSPKYIFDSLLSYCHQNKVVRPSYSTLQEVISDAIDNEKSRLSNKLYVLMDKQLRNDLDFLLEKDDDFYQLTNLKKDQKDFSTTEIRKTVTKHQSLDSLYQNTTEIINQLGLSEQNMRYYSDLAAYYTVYGLKSMRKKNLARLYLLCYIRHRYLELNDHLMFSFTHKVSYYKSEGEAYKEKTLELHQSNNNDDIEKAGIILSLFMNKKVTDNELRNKA